MMEVMMPTTHKLMWHIMCVVVCLSVTVFAGCSTSKPKRGMLSLSKAEFDQKMQEDLALIKRYDDGLRQTIIYARAHPELFPKPKKGEPLSMTQEQRHELRTIWRNMLDYMRAVDSIKQYWRDFHKINAVKNPKLHADAFFVGYAAWMVQYHHGLDFIDLTVPSEPLEVLLDEASPKYEIPKGAFKNLKWNIINVKAVSRFLGSRGYYKVNRGKIKAKTCLKDEICNWSLKTVESYHILSKQQLAQRAAIQFSYNAFDIVRDLSFRAWFPVQKNVAEWMGDTKIKRLTKHLINKKQLAEMQKKMQPGDIIVARHNWYLSNVGLPGFWPHAELYIGSHEELTAYFDVPEVTKGMPELQGKTFSTYLKDKHPKLWAQYQKKDGDYPYRVIEAISEGVVLSSLEKAAGADYVGVLRPKFTKIAKARAVLRAFSYYGRPYDFNFDFLTEESIVCTELVYKAWQPGKNKRGIDLKLISVMGRPTLPANEIVKQYAAQMTLPEEKRQMEFVYFLDGREKQSKAIIASEKSFVESWERPKWDTSQQ